MRQVTPLNATRWAIGSDPDSDLVLDHASVAPRHAVLTRERDGHLWLEAATERALDLYRNGQWLQAERLTLCAGDRVRAGERDLPLTELTALAGPGVILRPVRFPAPGAEQAAHDALRRPVRDPHTGLIGEGGE